MRPKGVSSGVIPPPPSSTGADTAEAFGAAAADADVLHQLLWMIQTFDVH